MLGVGARPTQLGSCLLHRWDAPGVRSSWLSQRSVQVLRRRRAQRGAPGTWCAPSRRCASACSTPANHSRRRSVPSSSARWEVPSRCSRASTASKLLGSSRPSVCRGLTRPRGCRPASSQAVLDVSSGADTSSAWRRRSSCLQAYGMAPRGAWGAHWGLPSGRACLVQG